MITRDDIRELASFRADQNCAVTFYFQPGIPKDKSHREEQILVKDLVKEALHEAEKHGKNGCARADLERVLGIAEALHGNHSRAKAIFACAKQNFWREFDLPARLPGTGIQVNRRFHLKPLSALAPLLPKVGIAVMDRSKARLFQLQMDQIREVEDFFVKLPRRGRSDGWLGFDAGHAERHLENEAAQHLKFIAERIKGLYDQGAVDKLIIGCRDQIWPEIQSELHPYLQQRLVGHFAADVVRASAEEIKAEAERLLAEFRLARREVLIREAIGEAGRDGRGRLGLKHVLGAMDKGEVQTLLLGRSLSAPAAECTNCGFIDVNVPKQCKVCAAETREIEDVADAIISAAVRNGTEIVYVDNDPEFERVGNIAAVLRFRADQNTELKKAV